MSWRLKLFEVKDGDDDQQVPKNCCEDHQHHQNIHSHFNNSKMLYFRTGMDSRETHSQSQFH